MATAVLRPALAAATPITYLLPAPAILPAFLPFRVAQQRKYFEANGVEVTFATGRGATAGGAPRSHAASAKTRARAGTRMGFIVRAMTRTGNHPLRENE